MNRLGINKVKRLNPFALYKNRNISTTLYIKGLPLETTEESLKKNLTKYGDIQKLVIFKLPDKAKRVNAMVDFLNLNSALSAQDELDQSTLNGFRIDVEFPVKEHRKENV